MPEICFLCGTKPNQIPQLVGDIQILTCKKCEIAFQKQSACNPLEYYKSNKYYEAWWKDKEAEWAGVTRIKEMTANWVLDQMKDVLKPGAKIFEVGCAFGHFLKAAKKRGYQVSGVEISEACQEITDEGINIYHKRLEDLNLEEGSFDAVVMLDVIEHFEDPDFALRKIKQILNKKHGIIALITPNYESLTRKILRSAWWHFKQEHLYYFSKKGLLKLFQNYGFEVINLKRAVKGTSLSYISSCSERYRNLPSFLNVSLRKLPFSSVPFLVSSDLFCIAKVMR